MASQKIVNSDMIKNDLIKQDMISGSENLADSIIFAISAQKACELCITIVKYDLIYTK
jgi:hypothetical protein